MSSGRMIVVGRVSGLYGVKGWFRVNSYTEPKEGIINYSTWYLKRDGEWVETELLAGRRHGKSVIAQVQGCSDRDQAAQLKGCEIAVRREQLPEPADGEYYWSDLQGLRVENLQGIQFGRIDYLFATGANDVIVVEGERQRLIPFTRGEAVQSIDLESGLMVVDWDADF